MNRAVFSILPVAGIYAIVALYHVYSAYASGQVVDCFEGVKATGTTYLSVLFLAALLASVLAWFGAFLYFLILGYRGLRGSPLGGWTKRIMLGVAIWCVVQPIVTSLCLPQALSLFHISADAKAHQFISVFQYSRLPGFAFGLMVAFTFGILVYSLGSRPTAEHASRVRGQLIRGFFIFIALVVLGVVRLVVAQHAIDLGDSASEAVPKAFRIEIVTYTVYYSMMAMIACIGAMVSFNALIDDSEEVRKFKFGTGDHLKAVAGSLSTFGAIVLEYFINRT